MLGSASLLSETLVSGLVSQHTGGVRRCRGQPEAGGQTIAAFLRRIRAEGGAPLPELRFWSELSMFFFAGASSWPPPQPCLPSTALWREQDIMGASHLTCCNRWENEEAELVWQLFNGKSVIS